MHLQHPLSVATVPGPQVNAAGGDKGSHPLGSFLDIGDVSGPEGSAGVTLLAGWERRVVARGALVTENTRDASPTVTFTGFRVTRWTFGSLHVTVTS